MEMSFICYMKIIHADNNMVQSKIMYVKYPIINKHILDRNIIIVNVTRYCIVTTMM